MKHRLLIKKIRAAAKTAAIPFARVPGRGKGSHQLWRCGRTNVVIPKHTEVNEITAESICKTLEPELGERWWR